jgi:hypothetical protein
VVEFKQKKQKKIKKIKKKPQKGKSSNLRLNTTNKIYQTAEGFWHSPALERSR